MKLLPSRSLSLPLLFLLVWLTGSALALPSLHRLVRRAVSWVNPSTERASSSICSPDQQGWIAHFQTETALLAKAGADALGWMFYALVSPAQFSQLDEVERARLVQTYISFFGAPDEDDIGFDTTQITAVKAILDHIAGLTPESYPDTLRIGCDSSFYNELDPEGKDVYTRHPGTGDPPAGKIWQHDDDAPPGGFQSIFEFTQCKTYGNEYPAFTNGWSNSQTERTIFCPPFWMRSLTLLADARGGIQQDQSDLGMFAHLGARLYFHEMLHVAAVTGQAWGDEARLGDVEKENSYGHVNAFRFAETDRVKAWRNIENIVYWCVAMFYGEYDWRDGVAREKKA